MKTLALLLLSTLGALAQGGSYCTMSTWEPRNIATKAGLVASYDPGLSTATAGTGIAAVSNLVTVGTGDLLQATAANQPSISRQDNCGNLVAWSETLSNAGWGRFRINAFGASDVTNTLNSGSFENTTRVPDPVGNNTADFIQEDTTASNTHRLLSSLQVPKGESSYSAWVRDGGRTWCRLILTVNGVGSAYCYFDVANGVVGTVAMGTSWTGVTGTIVAGPVNGYYLCRLRGTTSSAVGSGSVIIAIATGDGGDTYNGDGTSGLFVWGQSLVFKDWISVTGTDIAHGYVATTSRNIMPGLSGHRVLDFNGSGYTMKTASFTLNQPTELYVQSCPWSWTIGDAMLDGNTLASGLIYQTNAAPQVRANAGTASAQFLKLQMSTWLVHNIVFDGANSRMSTNNGTFIVSDAGTNSMSGFTLGAAGVVGTTYWNGMIGRVLICNKTNSAAEADYLRWGLRKGTELPFTNIMFIGDSKTIPSMINPLIASLNSYQELPARIAVVGASTASTAAAIDADLAARTDIPAAICINLGVNDYAALQAGATNQWKIDCAYVLDALHAKWPSARIFWARVWARGEMTDVPPAYSMTYLDDVLLPDVLSTRSWAAVGIDERNILEGGDDGATYTSDGFHPTIPDGYALEATAWKTVLGY